MREGGGLSSEGPALPPGYTLREVDRFDDDLIAELVRENLTRNSGVFELKRALDPGQREAVDALQAARGKDTVFTLHVGIWQGDEVVAWTFCRARGPGSLVMMASGVRPAHRRRGLYSALLRHVTSRAEAVGFEVLESFHNASNNPILIAKLREGWHVSGLEQSLHVGLLVKLERYLRPEHEALFHVRTGWRPPTDWSLGLLPPEE